MPILHIGSAHNKRGIIEYKYTRAQNSYLLNFYRIETFLHSFMRIVNQNSVCYSVSPTYFLLLEIQNVKKAFVYMTEFAAS